MPLVWDVGFEIGLLRKGSGPPNLSLHRNSSFGTPNHEHTRVAKVGLAHIPSLNLTCRRHVIRLAALIWNILQERRECNH